MLRGSLAVLAALLLCAGALLAPVDAAGSRTTVAKVLPDGRAQEAQGLEVMSDPPPLPPLAEQPSDGGSSAPAANLTGPDPGALQADMARPTHTVTFYGHIFGVGLVPQQNGKEFGPNGPQAANTIYPTGDANLGTGLFDDCSDAGNFAGLVPQPTGTSGCDKDPNNKVALYLTAGPVQVHSPQDFAYSKLHNEHGRTKDVVLDTSGKITADLWMTLDFHSWPTGNGNDSTACVLALPHDVGCPYPYWGWDPAYWPQWVVEAKLYLADLGDYGQGASQPPAILEHFNAGDMTLLAEGATPPTDVQNGIPGQPNVHDFRVDLGSPKLDVIPKTKDIVLVFSFYSIVNGQKVAISNWRIWSGELFPASFTLPVKNALDVEYVIPLFAHDKLTVTGVIASAFGSYDVDDDNAALAVTGPDGQPVTPTPGLVTRIGDYQVAHGAHFKPVNMTWIWNYQAEKPPLKPGTYKVAVSACNAQHSDCETTLGSFTIDANGLPLAVNVGRQGQSTVTEAQLQAIAAGAGQGSAAFDAAGSPPAGAPARAVPGSGPFLLTVAAAAAAMLLRRRLD